MRQVRRPANVVRGASLRGIVFDACYDNRIPNTFGVLQHFGMPNRNRVLVSESVHLDVTGLATALRIDEAEVTTRRYPAHGRGHRSFHGLLVMRSRMEDRVRRFSPAAIAAGVRHHPATHELRDLPFSTVGWDMLQDSCPCTDQGVRQGWVTVNGSSRCQSCGGDLGRIAPVPVPLDLREPLELIAGLVDPEPTARTARLQKLPMALSQTDRTLIYDLIMNLTRHFAGDVGGAQAKIRRTAAMALACEAVLQWPNGLQALEGAPGNSPHSGDWARRAYAVLDAVGNVHVPKTASESLPVVAIGAGPVGSLAYDPRGSGGRLKTALIGAMAAARLSGIDEAGLKSAWDEGRFTQHVWVNGSRRVRAWDPAEVITRAPLFRVVHGRARAAAMLGVPIYGVEQLLANGTLAPDPPSSAMKQTEAHEAAARALISRMIQAQAHVAGPVRLADAIRHVSGRAKAWGATFAAMLDGTIPFRVDPNGPKAPLIGRVSVPADSIPTICGLSEPRTAMVVVERSVRWSQSDALECLNGNRKEPPNALQGLATEGRSPKTFAVEDILQRALAGVTTADLARRHRRSIMRTAMILAGDAVPQIAPGLWERDRAESASLRVEAFQASAVKGSTSTATRPASLGCPA